MQRTSRTSWMKTLCCCPINRVNPITDSTEELPEDQLEELSISTLEKEALPKSIACEQASEHAPQEDLVLELPQAGAEEPPLRPLEESRAAYEHALQEDLVVKPPEAWAKKQPQRTLKAYGAAYEHDFTEDLPVNPPCDNTEDIEYFSKVALSGCETDCFLESLSISDAEDYAATPVECCPQTPDTKKISGHLF
ncbi:uncharacterized protein [Bos indicus]|uniref:Uncharacterized protein isoform X15 n=1 Tax=Bos indicus TaxID=9915 RepID=A0ABM4S1B7_BOSIN